MKKYEVFLADECAKFSKIPSPTRLHLESFDGANICRQILLGYDVDIREFISNEVEREGCSTIAVVVHLLQTRCVVSTIRDLYMAMIQNNFHDYTIALNFLSYLCEMYLTAINFDRDQDLLGELCPTPLSVIDQYIN